MTTQEKNGVPLRGPARARRIKFNFGEPMPMKKYYVDNDIAQSHVITMMSAAFPPGEELFIRAVKRYSDSLTDRQLKERVAGFIGQEKTHGREHRNLNEQLVALGYPIGWVDELVERAVPLERFVHPLLPLAFTAAAEHATATLAERVLGSKEVQELAFDDEVRALLNWHAFEELEHKSVAFDVYRAVGGPEWLRIGIVLAGAFATPLVTVGILASLLADPYARTHPLQSLVSLAKLPWTPAYQGLGQTLARYLKPGFHPDDIDTNELLERWRTELFGDNGSLIDHLK